MMGTFTGPLHFSGFFVPCINEGVYVGFRHLAGIGFLGVVAFFIIDKTRQQFCAPSAKAVTWVSCAMPCVRAACSRYIFMVCRSSSMAETTHVFSTILRWY